MGGKKIIIVLQDVCRSVLLKSLLNHSYFNGSHAKFQNHGSEIKIIMNTGIITVLVTLQTCLEQEYVFSILKRVIKQRTWCRCVCYARKWRWNQRGINL